jgi:pyrroloquinoline quinone biosynthesis protein B
VKYFRIYFCLIFLINYQIIKGQRSSVKLNVIGTIQDGGSPHIRCEKKCCKFLSEEEKNKRLVSSLALVDLENYKLFLFEATPDIEKQLRLLNNNSKKELTINGIFLTHAHIGHYSGLMYLGKEALGAEKTPVFSMPKMSNFLMNNGPWSQLVDDQNIVINKILENKNIVLNKNVSVFPIKVPHRDEYSETVGYYIKGRHKTALFLPDIDKWNKWNKSLIEVLKKVDYAFIDATFYDNKEIKNRDISEIPHPFVIETMNLLEDLSISERKKVYLIHMNHTNPLLDSSTKEYKTVINFGFNVAEIGMTFYL